MGKNGVLILLKLGWYDVSCAVKSMLFFVNNTREGDEK